MLKRVIRSFQNILVNLFSGQVVCTVPIPHRTGLTLNLINNIGFFERERERGGHGVFWLMIIIILLSLSQVNNNIIINDKGKVICATTQGSSYVLLLGSEVSKGYLSSELKLQ